MFYIKAANFDFRVFLNVDVSYNVSKVQTDDFNMLTECQL